MCKKPHLQIVSFNIIRPGYLSALTAGAELFAKKDVIYADPSRSMQYYGNFHEDAASGDSVKEFSPYHGNCDSLSIDMRRVAAYLRYDITLL